MRGRLRKRLYLYTVWMSCLMGAVGALPHSNPLDEPLHIQEWVATNLNFSAAPL